MRPSLRLGLMAIALLLTASSVCAAPLTLESLRKVVRLTGVSLSPDGARVAFVRGVADYQRDKFKRTLMVVSSKGGTPRALTNTYDRMINPQWSPSGAQISYLATGPRRVMQLFVVPVAGGTPVQITHTKKDVQQYSWSPNGKQIAYVTADGPVDTVAAKRDDLWEVHDDGFLDKYRPRSSHIWLIGSRGGTPRRLTSGSWSYLEAAAPFVGRSIDPSWSADGKAIAFIMQANADNSDSDLTRVAQVDVQSGKVTPVDSRTTYEYEPQFAPSGRAIAYLYPHGPGPISVLDVWVANGGQNVDVTSNLDRDVLDVAWLPQNRLLLLAVDSTQAALYVQPLPTGAARRVSLGRLNPTEMSVSSNGKIAIIASASDVPAEIYVLDSATGVPRTVTNLNAQTAALDYGKSTEITWKASDGERSNGILTYPAGYQPGKKYPLVLRIHSGPEASSRMGFTDLRQLFAGRGYIVFEPNYRGSDNLGSAHEHAIFKDPGAGPARDVMAGIEAIEQLGIVDSSRIAVTGHSYGGYMTAWLITHFHNWRSAVLGDPLTDWVEGYNLSATGNLAFSRDSLGGSPWVPENAAIYRDGSPITYVHDVKTPTRIITGTNDDTAPFTQSYAFYHALKDLGVPVSLIAIPNAKHFPTDPVRIEGYNRVTLEWVDRYMR